MIIVPKFRSTKPANSSTNGDKQYAEDFEKLFGEIGWFRGQELGENLESSKDWTHCGANDDKDWEHKQNPPWMVPQKKIVAPQESIHSKNLKKGRCPHGVPWYHAETECGWCRVATLQQEENAVNYINLVEEGQQVNEEKIQPTVFVKRLNGRSGSLN